MSNWPFWEIRLSEAGHDSCTGEGKWTGVTAEEWREIKAGAELLGVQSTAFRKLARAMRRTETLRDEIAGVLADADHNGRCLALGIPDEQPIAEA